MLSIYEVLSLPARREILDRLREGPKLVGELAVALGVSQPIMSKHLRILRDSGFVTVQVDAQRRWYELRSEPLMELDAWLEPFRAKWEQHLDRLGDHLDAMREEEENQ